jgi:hypothetical protein
MDPVARERALARQRAAADTVLSLEKRERERPKNVRDDLLWAGQMIREDERTRLMNNRNYVQSWKNEVRRWQVRAPDYAREAGKVFAGDVKRAHDTSVQMID